MLLVYGKWISIYSDYHYIQYKPALIGSIKNLIAKLYYDISRFMMIYVSMCITSESLQHVLQAMYLNRLWDDSIDLMFIFQMWHILLYPINCKDILGILFMSSPIRKHQSKFPHASYYLATINVWNSTTFDTFLPMKYILKRTWGVGSGVE